MYLSAQNGMRARSSVALMSGLSGRASSKTRRSMGRYLSRSLGALTPDQAAEQVFPLAQVKTAAGHNKAVRDQILASVQAGQIVNAQGGSDYVPGTSQCAATGQSTNVKLAQISGGMALTGINVAAALSSSVAAVVGTALGPLTLGISTLIGLFPLFFGHHAKAVKKEQSVLCSAVPAANNYLQVIDQGVSSGQVTPQQAIAALNSMLSDFGSQVASIRKGVDPMSTGECNAACVEYAKLRAIVLAKASQYQDMQASASAPLSVSTLTASTGIPSWALYAAGGLLLWKLL